MRLLAQPVYRYENTNGDLIDGACGSAANVSAPKGCATIDRTLGRSA
jgi:hypothetical protein